MTFTKKQKLKVNDMVAAAVKAKRIIRPSKCSKCGSSRGTICAHHEDYSKPFGITWLCHHCHVKRHISDMVD
jgi:hypothetical protein